MNTRCNSSGLQFCQAALSEVRICHDRASFAAGRAFGRDELSCHAVRTTLLLFTPGIRKKPTPSQERVRERLQPWLDSPVTTMNLTVFDTDTLRTTVELVGELS